MYAVDNRERNLQSEQGEDYGGERKRIECFTKVYQEDPDNTGFFVEIFEDFVLNKL